MYELRLDWPPAILNPNARPNVFRKARSTKGYRETCHWLAKIAPKPVLPPDGPIPIELTFCPPDARARDDDNFEAAFKAGRDGVAAAWGVDDSRFRVTKHLGAPVKGGAVIVRLPPEEGGVAAPSQSSARPPGFGSPAEAVPPKNLQAGSLAPDSSPPPSA